MTVLGKKTKTSRKK